MNALRGLKLAKLPWTMMSKDVRKFVADEICPDVKYCRVVYDSEAGLSRGVAFVGIGDARKTEQLITMGKFEGREIYCVVEGSEWLDAKDSLDNKKET